MPRLTPQEQQEIFRFIEADKPLPEKYRFLLFADGDISNYYPDFIVKLSGKKIAIVETKGLEDLDVPLKVMRLKQWCEDVNRVQDEVTFDYVFIDQEGFEKYQPKNFRALANGFIQYRP